MKILLFGATGMIGQGVLRAALADERVTRVLAVGRSPLGTTHDKLRELRHADVYDYSAVADELAGYDACLYCLGVSSAGMSEAEYTRITYDATMAAARTIAERAPGTKFLYVSGASTDSTEKGKTMWARVKGRTENALLALFADAYMLRPGYIQPLDGIRSSTLVYRMTYAIAAPLYPLWKAIGKGSVTTTRELGAAMLEVAHAGADRRVLEARDLVRTGSAALGDG